VVSGSIIKPVYSPPPLRRSLRSKAYCVLGAMKHWLRHHVSLMLWGECVTNDYGTSMLRVWPIEVQTYRDVGSGSRRPDPLTRVGDLILRTVTGQW